MSEPNTLCSLCQLRSELERRREELGAFQAIARAASLSLPPEEILQAALEQAAALVRADVGFILLRSEHSQRPPILAVYGPLPAPLRDPVTLEPLDRAVGAQEEPTLIVDAQSSPFRQWLPEALPAAGYSTFLFASLGPRGRARGTIALAARSPERFGPQEAALLQPLSEQIGVAVDNARLYAEARQRAEEMSNLYDLSLVASSLDLEAMLQVIGDRIMHLFDAACFFVALVDEEFSQLHLAHIMDRGRRLAPFSVPLADESGLAVHVLRTGAPLLITDLKTEAGALPVAPMHLGDAARSWLGVPLVAKGRTIGVMSVQAYVPGAFDENDQRLLSLAAQQAAAAMENARLFQETRVLERRYHKLLEDLNDGYAVLQEGHLVFANARLGEMLGSAPEALLVSSLDALLVHDSSEDALIPTRLGEPGSEPVHYRTRLQKRDGGELPVEVTLSRIDYEGRPALAVLCRDVSSQVRLEAQLLQAEKLSAVGQLVSGVAHELNNPMTTIKGYAQLLQGEGLPPSVVHDLQRIEEAADRCRRIVRDLLTFARRYEPERVDTDVNELMQRTVALRSYELRVRNIQVEWDLDPLLPVIQADPHRLQQVILNLIFNAEQALLSEGEGIEGGRIRLSSQASPDRKHIRFMVSDNGPGIRPEYIDRIFDPFFTTKEVGAGTGLGLSISYGIVKEHYGRIWAQSRPGAGATFFVELPVAGQAPTAAAEALSAGKE